MVVRGGKKRERSPKGERRRIVIVAVVYVALFFAVATFSCCLALPCSQAESTEDITVVHQTLETAHLRAPRARAPPAEPERANKTGGDGIGEQASRGNKPKAKRRNECIHKTIRNKQHSCALRAARSTSIARLHQRLDASRQSAAQRAKQRHAILRHGKKKAATASQRCSRRRRAWGKKRDRSPPFPPRHAFSHHKVRVQDAKLDRLDALDRRRRVREAVHRRHDGEKRGPVVAVDSPLVVLLLLCSLLPRYCDVTRQALSRAACVRRARATAERNGQARGAHRKTERCLVFLFFFFFCLALPSSSALGGGSESSAPLTMPTKKKVDAPAGGEKRCLSFPSSLRRGKRAWPVPSCSRSLLPERFPALPERDGGSEGSFVSRKQKEENVSITLSPFFSLCRRSLLL